MRRHGHKAKRGKRKGRHHWIGDGESGRQTEEEMMQALGGPKAGRDGAGTVNPEKRLPDDLIPAEKVGSDRNGVEKQRAGTAGQS